ncbi:MAG: nucleotidyltransferase family protein [Gracilibacteraceae bacterium]|jgi:glucose-1-phosphate thymidylyltransferase|nr:nucleotidyltransferase family protein [Gracilibacteraceae bacterium]
MIAIILVAGYATRLYPLTLDRPKALLPIGGRPILDYICDEIDSVEDIHKTVLVSNDKFYASFLDWVETRRPRAELAVLNDGTRVEGARLGAIGDIRFALQKENIREDIAVIAGDNFFTYRLADFCRFYRERGADCLAVKKMPDREALKSMGVVISDAAGRVLELEEKPQNPRSDVAAYASYIYKEDTLPLFSEYLDNNGQPDAPGNFVAWLCARKPVWAWFIDGECYDVGTHASYDEVCRKYG